MASVTAYHVKITIFSFDTLDSTNAEALKQARTGADEGVCIIARRQTAGRGRHGRRWVSEKDAGLYFSIILRPRIEMRFLPLITLMAGVAVHDTLGSVGIEADIKWVNDLLVNEKKIGGILAETAETDTGIAVVVGIGINLAIADLPDEIAAIATSVESETGSVPDREKFIGSLTASLSTRYGQLSAPNGPELIRSEWIKRSSYGYGKNVRVSTGTEIVTGITDGIEENGALCIRKPDGTIVAIHAGDVQKLRA